MNNTRFLHKTPARPFCLRLPILLAIACSCLSLPVPAEDKTAAQEISFNRDIRPIFAANCFLCHGPDKKNRKARLRLDEEKGIARVFRKENLAENKAWLRINSKDEEKIMPPPDSHKELTAEEIEKIGAWIKGGAAWQGHWAYIT
ncbi:MAG: c-type cytochrome domain-containing protein, partial [Planctomycetota bacterium]|nr:c-type cytochrome domain-containing protein [Planctomycetota bacterium]